MKKIIYSRWGWTALLFWGAASLWAQATDTFTTTPTLTPSPTPLTATPTPTATACSTLAFWGESSINSGSVSLTGTLFQKYSLSQPAQLSFLTTDIASIPGTATLQMGVYADGGTYPSYLIYQTQSQTAVAGTNMFNVSAANVNLNPGSYWLALDVLSGMAFVTVGGSTASSQVQTDMDMPNPFPAALNPPLNPTGNMFLSAWTNNCNGYVATQTPLPTNTPTLTPTPTPTPGAVVMYNNPDTACATAFGCSVAFVDGCRLLQLDFATSYILMRLGATCGCQPSDIMNLRLTMSWDQIVAYYGLDWTTFITELQTRINTLQPEQDTPNMILRSAANDPTQYPLETPVPMPGTLPQNAPITEVCPLCP